MYLDTWPSITQVTCQENIERDNYVWTQVYDIYSGSGMLVLNEKGESAVRPQVKLIKGMKKN